MKHAKTSQFLSVLLACFMLTFAVLKAQGCKLTSSNTNNAHAQKEQTTTPKPKAKQPQNTKPEQGKPKDLTNNNPTILPGTKSGAFGAGSDPSNYVIGRTTEERDRDKDKQKPLTNEEIDLLPSTKRGVIWFPGQDSSKDGPPPGGALINPHELEKLEKQTKKAKNKKSPIPLKGN